MSFLRQQAPSELSHQIGIILYIFMRDRLFRFAMTSILIISMLYFMPNVYSYATTAILIAMELLTLSLAIPYLKKRPKVTNGFAFSALAAKFLSATACVLPSLILVSSPDFPIRFMGLIWLMGVSGYLAHTYASVVYFYWMSFLPAIGGSVAAVIILYNTIAENYPIIEWLSMAAFMALYLCSALSMLLRQRDTLQALTRARNDAHARMVELEYLSQSDPLTSLANRHAFDEKLKSLLSNDAKPKHDLAVALIDLDQFKPINDSFGHEAGDHLLIETASRLEEFVKRRGFAARFGGDEFALVVRDVKSRAHAQELGNQLSDLLAEPFEYQSEVISVSGSIGISRVADVGEELNILCKTADQAMFQAKRKPGASVVVYDGKNTTPRVSLREKTVLETAITQGQIKPFYQPQIDMLTGKIHGVEALARWENPDAGLVMPGNFIPKLEELGLMGNFTFAILRRVLQDIDAWQAQGLQLESVSVNLDEKTLATQTGMQDLIWLITEYKEAAKVLTLEVTEDVVLARSGEFIRRSIETLVEMGVRVSLDDFGTGFASFRHLQELTLHEMKIDTSFVTTIGKDPVSKVIIEGFLAIAAGLNISVVAEGVETKAQQDFLLERGCYIGQGFLYSKAVTAKSINRLLIQNSNLLLQSA